MYLAINKKCDSIISGVERLFFYEFGKNKVQLSHWSQFILLAFYKKARLTRKW